jgi:hypothetical protein
MRTHLSKSRIEIVKNIKLVTHRSIKTRSLMLLAILFVCIEGCSIIGDPSVHKNWSYTQYNRMETFADRPNAKYSNLLLPAEREQCAPGVVPKSDELTIAAREVRWDMNSDCRNTYPAAGGKAPSRSEVVTACTAPERAPDTNFIALGISGGGTKSATFATQAMFAMDQWRLLDQVDMISSVSGGSFAAAIYALSCDADQTGEMCDEDANARPRWPRWKSSSTPERCVRLKPWQKLQAGQTECLPCPDPRRDGTCPEWTGHDRLYQQWDAINARAQANLLWPFFTRRFDATDQFMRAMSHRKSSNVLADSIDWRVLGRPDGIIAGPAPEGFFAVGTGGQSFVLGRSRIGTLPATFAPGPDQKQRLQFGDLNPRRPNLVLNSTNVTADRRYLEAEAGIPPEQRLLSEKADRMHFAFTDHYFEKMLHADLASYPVAHAVAASAAFPALVDYITVGRFMKPGSYGNACGIDYVHLTDGGVLDNQGLTAIRLALKDALRQQPSKRPERVLAVVVDSSGTMVNGLSRNDPLPLGLDATVVPLRVANIDEASSLLTAANTVQHEERFTRFLENDVQRDCSGENGPTSKSATCARQVRVSFEGMDGYDGVLVDDRHLRCDDPAAIAYLDAAPHDPERIRQRRQCAAMAALRTPEAKARLGLGAYHPQCYLEAVRSAATSYLIDEDMAICLEHAARWAVAMRMTELCADPKFGGDADRSKQKQLPIGVECPLPSTPLPPLPKECKYEQLVNTRAWADMPRQTAHCACTDPYKCRPEDLLTGEAIDTGWKPKLDDASYRAGLN